MRIVVCCGYDSGPHAAHDDMHVTSHLVFIYRQQSQLSNFAAEHHVWEWTDDRGGGLSLVGRGEDEVCTRDELVARVEEFCGDGKLHVQVSFWGLRRCTQVPPPSPLHHPDGGAMHHTPIPVRCTCLLQYMSSAIHVFRTTLMYCRRFVVVVVVHIQ